ncbi:MAG: sigma 54-interacting transcriptional regulator [Deferribacteres bacterium]|nr:sigma 54-interacting transcriptional regulator [candidate division KSB1 bacterium]MCB9512570.1 sigma 54-interacting transcriptional regulator [Deferribacteres bacterium]
MLSGKTQKHRNLIFATFALSIFFSAGNFLWGSRIDLPLADVLFLMRGERPLSKDILFVHIGDDDIKAVGSWPITRDFFSYITYVLNEGGATAIALDFLLSEPDPLYPEFDRAFADFLESTPNVILPMVFQDFDISRNEHHRSQLYHGGEPQVPFGPFAKHAAAVGFSNLGNSAVIRSVPVVVDDSAGAAFSFGVEMARVFLGYDSLQVQQNVLALVDDSMPDISIELQPHGELRLNHFGKVGLTQHIGFFELLKLYEDLPDSLEQIVSGKLVIVAASSAALPVLKATPFTDTFPAALIHAIVAENIVKQIYLRSMSARLQTATIILLAWLPFVIAANIARKWIYAGMALLLLTYFALSTAMFIFAFFVFPLFFPITALLASAILQIAWQYSTRKKQIVADKMQLVAEINEKIAALKDAEHGLAEIEAQLQQSRELHNMAKEESKRLADERRQALERIDNLLKDMQSDRSSVSIDDTDPQGIVFSHDSPMAGIIMLVEKVAKDTIPVLILGETGTGKEMVAKAIHANSLRKDCDFIAVNCGALPEQLLESELFGHEKGSFTGAHSRRRGRFELANRGTIFLDEITETSTAFQIKLLRILQEGSFERLGSEETVHTDVRVICACNINLKRAVDNGNFRSDLFYRLNGFMVQLPALRERTSDIAVLAESFLSKHGFDNLSISKQAMARLRQYRWPGNVRELENAVRRASILAQSEDRQLIQELDLPDEVREVKDDASPAAQYLSFEDQILDSLRNQQFARSAISQTASALGNRDRGTITEYFRGICFQALVNADYSVAAAAEKIAATDDTDVIANVEKKLIEYLGNLQQTDAHSAKSEAPNSSAFQGLPKQYHESLKAVMLHLDAILESRIK